MLSTSVGKGRTEAQLDPGKSLICGKSFPSTTSQLFALSTHTTTDKYTSTTPLKYLSVIIIVIISQFTQRDQREDISSVAYKNANQSVT